MCGSLQSFLQRKNFKKFVLISCALREQLTDVDENSRNMHFPYWNWKSNDTICSTAFMGNVTTRKNFIDKFLGSQNFKDMIDQYQVSFFHINSFPKNPLLNFQDIFDIEASYNFLPFIGWNNGDTKNIVLGKSLFDSDQIEVVNMLLCTNRKSGQR